MDLNSVKLEKDALIFEVRQLKNTLKTFQDSTIDKKAFDKLNQENEMIRRTVREKEMKLEEASRNSVHNDSFRNEVMQYKDENHRLINDLDNLKFKNKTLEDTNIGLIKEIRSFERKIQQYQHMEGEKQRLADNFDQMNRQNAYLKVENENLNKSKNNTSMQDFAKTNEINDLMRNIRTLEEENKDLKLKTSGKGDIINEQQKSSIENLRMTNERLMQEILRLNDHVKNYEKDMTLNMSLNMSHISHAPSNNYSRFGGPNPF